MHIPQTRSKTRENNHLRNNGGLTPGPCPTSRARMDTSLTAGGFIYTIGQFNPHINPSPIFTNTCPFNIDTIIPNERKTQRSNLEQATLNCQCGMFR